MSNAAFHKLEFSEEGERNSFNMLSDCLGLKQGNWWNEGATVRRLQNVEWEEFGAQTAGFGVYT